MGPIHYRCGMRAPKGHLPRRLAAERRCRLCPRPHALAIRVATSAPLGQRLILAGMFMLGLFVCIVSVIRLTEVMAISTEDQDVTWNLKDFILWSMVEIHIGLLCSCLPSMRRILRSLGLGKLFSRGSSADKDKTPGQSTPNGIRATEPSSNPDRSGHSRSRLKSGSVWSHLGLTKIDSDEDAYQMIDHEHAQNPNGKSQAGVEVGGRSSAETNEGTGSASNSAGITVHRDWSVQVNDDGRQRADR